jgi:hypothetical protein
VSDEHVAGLFDDIVALGKDGAFEALHVGNVFTGEVGNLLRGEASADVGLNVFGACLLPGGSTQGGASANLVDQGLVDGDREPFPRLVDHNQEVVFPSDNGQ